MGDYTQLCFKERRQIYMFLSMGKLVNTITQRLGRHRTITPSIVTSHRPILTNIETMV